MRKALATGAGVAAIALVAVLLTAPAAFAVSAVDQYSEGIPTAKGQETSSKAIGGAPGTATRISPQTQAQLEKSRKGAATEKAAKITAPPSRPNASSTNTSSGMGLLLPLILAASLGVAIAVFFARRRAGAAPG